MTREDRLEFCRVCTNLGWLCGLTEEMAALKRAIILLARASRRLNMSRNDKLLPVNLKPAIQGLWKE